MTISNAELMRAIGRLEGKVDALISSGEGAIERMNRIDAEHAKLEERVNKIDRKQYAILAVATVGWAIFTWASKLIFG